MEGERRDEERSGQEPERPVRPPVKVTDRRRVRADDVPAAHPPTELVPDDAEGGVSGEPAEALRRAEEYRELAQRLQADFDNYRKRVVKEQTRAVQMAAEPFARRLLEVLDDFDLAILATEGGGIAHDPEKLRKGVELVYAKLVDALRAEGLERIEAEGKPFDPNEHEALMQTGDGEGEAVVAEVFRQGYRLNGKVLRPAQVRVTRG